MSEPGCCSWQQVGLKPCKVFLSRAPWTTCSRDKPSWTSAKFATSCQNRTDNSCPLWVRSCQAAPGFSYLPGLGAHTAKLSSARLQLPWGHWYWAHYCFGSLKATLQSDWSLFLRTVWRSWNLTSIVCVLLRTLGNPSRTKLVNLR